MADNDYNDKNRVKDTQSDPLPKLENIYFLSVKVISAKNLDKSDFTSQSSDPFCRVIANKQSWQTKWIKNNLDPEWNEETSFVFFDEVAELKFEVYDHDQKSDPDKLCEGTLAVTEYYQDGNDGFSGDITLDNKTSTLKVCVSGRVIKPIDLEQKIDKLEEECSSQNDILAKKKDDVAALQKKQNDLIAKKTALDNQRNDLNASLDQLRVDYTQQKADNMDKQKDVDKYIEKKKLAQQQCDKKLEEINKKKLELKDYQNQYDNENDKNKDLNDQRNGYQDQVDNNDNGNGGYDNQ